MDDFPAPAGSGFRWPVGLSRSIPVPAGQLWNAISMPGNLEICHPFCERNPVTRWPGAGSRDEVHYLNGVVYERRFGDWVEGVGYDLEIGAMGGDTSSVSWRIQPIDEGSSGLEIVVSPHVVQAWPVMIRWVPHLVRVRPHLKSYLSSVIRGFEWFVTRGEPVPRNQFGSHPWFS
jgi:hypothetical protein